MNKYKAGDKVIIVGSDTLYLYANNYIGRMVNIVNVRSTGMGNKNRIYTVHIDKHVLVLCENEIKPCIQVGEQLLFPFMKE